MTWGEFCNLLSGIMPETPLGNIVSIRSEKDSKILKNFTKQQKKIRSDWKNRNAKNTDKQSYDQAMKNFENMFRAMAISK